jgi:hypothetical protein
MKRTVCRSRKSGKFSFRKLCSAFKRQRVRVGNSLVRRKK